MNKREASVKEIVAFLTRLASDVAANNAVGFTDLNKISEDFFAHLLNKIYGLNLINLNREKKNHPATDLGDDEAKITFQVSSDSSSKKVKECVSKYEKHELGKRFNKLRIIAIAWKKNKLSTDPAPAKEFFSYKTDIIDLTDLVADMGPLDIGKIEEIRDFLKSELDDYTRAGSANTVANEVETIARVVEFITGNKTTNISDWEEEPDPAGKIEHRFSEHADFLKKEILDLLPRYAEARKQVEIALGLDAASSEYLRSFLRSKSDDLLNKANNDPRKALTDLTEYLAEQVAAKGKQYDHMAVRFFVLDELIRCNVFPN